MTTFQKSLLAWVAGGVVGAFTFKEERVWGAVFGSLVIGAVVVDPILERRRLLAP